MIMKLFTLCLLLLPWVAAAQSEYQLQGRITDAATGAGIPYASVYCADCAYGGTITSEKGEYVLLAAQESVDVRVNHLMYGERTVRLSPGSSDVTLHVAPLELPGVTVDGSEAIKLVKRAFALLASKQDQYYRGEGFYRQTTRMNEVYSELLEYFVSVTYNSQGMAEWNIATGRYAVNPIPNRLLFENQSYFTRGVRVFKEDYDPEKFVVPLNPATYHLYDFRIAQRLRRKSGEVLIVDCIPTEGTAIDQITTARLYIERATGRLLQSEYTTGGPGMIEPEGGTIEGSSVMISIRYRTSEEGYPLIQSVNTSTTFDFITTADERYAVQIASLYLNFPPTPVAGARAANTDRAFADLQEVSKKKYRAKWWDRHPVVAATPPERKVIEQFNRQAYFGNYFDKR